MKRMRECSCETRETLIYSSMLLFFFLEDRISLFRDRKQELVKIFDDDENDLLDYLLVDFHF